MTKAHTPTEMSKGQSDNINNATKKFDYTAVADRLRTVSWSNYSHPTGVVNRFTVCKIRKRGPRCKQIVIRFMTVLLQKYRGQL